MEIYLPSWLLVLLLPLCALLLWFLICWPCSIPSTENSHFIPAFRTSASGIIQSSKIPSSRRLSLYFDDRLPILDLLEQPLTGDTWWQSSDLPNTLSDSVQVEPKGSKSPARGYLEDDPILFHTARTGYGPTILKNKTWAKIHPEQWEIHCFPQTEQISDKGAESTWTWDPKSRTI